MLWLFFLVAVAVTIITKSEELLLFVAAGLIYMILKAPPSWIRKPSTFHGFFFINIGFWQADYSELLKIALFFTKVGAFVLVAAWPSFHFIMEG